MGQCIKGQKGDGEKGRRGEKNPPGGETGCDILKLWS